MVTIMERICAAVTCFNNSVKNPFATFFPFPNDFELAKRWAAAAGRDDLIKYQSVCSRSYLCSDHFESMYLQSHNNNIWFKFGVEPVPTIFDVPSNSAWYSLYEHDYCKRQETVKTEDICKLSEQSKTNSQSSLQMETKKSDTMNNNNSFEQCKYNSNGLQDIRTDSSTAFGGGVFSIYNLQRCRLCTVQFPTIMLTSIFDNQCVSKYLKLLEMCLPVKMHKNDGLPHYICYSCFMKLEQCYESLNTFRNAYNKHREKISSETKSSESNNNAINIQSDINIEADLHYICSVCSKLFPSQNDLNSHRSSEHLLSESEMNIQKQADTYVKKMAVKSDEKQCRNKDENMQNNRQSLDGVVGSIDSENDCQANHFSAETRSKQCMSLNTDTADVSSVKSAETERRLVNGTLKSTVSQIRPKKIIELTYNAESPKYQVQHRDNSTTFTVNIATKENTSSAAPLKMSTNNDKIKLIYECSFCSRWLTSKKKLVEHCIAVHKTAKDEKITCRELKTIVTGNGVEPSHNALSNDENIRLDNTEVDTKNSESHRYAYKCGQCSKQLPTKEDLISHSVANKCFNAQNQIVCKQVKLQSMPMK